MPTFSDVRARHAAAAAAAVDECQLVWPGMHDALRTIRRLRSGVAAGGGTADLEVFLEACWRWMTLLTHTPLSPKAAGTPSLRDAAVQLLASGRDSRFHEEIAQLAGILERLEAEAHPAAGVLEDLVSRYGRSGTDDPPAVYIAASRSHVADIEGWLAGEGLDAEVRTLAELRDAEVRDALILLGPPGHYLISPWCPSTRAERRGGWLLNAPPARAVHVVTWPGHPGLDLRTGALLPHSAPLALTRTQFTPADDVPRTPDEIIWLPPAPIEPHIVVRLSARDRDPVAAVGFRLAGDTVAFYSSGAGPRPEVVTFDLGTVQINLTDPAKVSVGRALLFRPERTAVDAELQRRADERLIAHRGAGAPEAAQAAKRELKEALWGCTKPYDEIVDQLAVRLGDRHYATYVLSRLHDVDYIGPEKPGAYDALRAVFCLPFDTDGRERGLLGSLRASLRHAGITITAELVAALKITSGWQDELVSVGEATVAAGELLGHLDIRVVTAVDPEPKTVGRSRLGRLHPSDRSQLR